ncbi:MAG: alcohol dehydrogenase catalytic domain-containing protein, partial [Dehalococcoidia bacterium]
MKAVTFQGPYKVEVRDVPDPAIQEPTDAIIRVTTSAICGSDLHVYNGRLPLPATGWIIGHEYIGVIEEVGPDVTDFKRGDRVVGSFSAGCGDCFYCRGRLSSQCLRQQPFGFFTLAGAQAQYLRVPFSSFTLEKVPDSLSDEQAVFLGDILSTGYFAADQGGIGKGDVVAVVGCGAVGLFALMSARLFNPKAVIAIDSLPERLALAERVGAVAVDMGQGDPAAVIREHTEGRGADVVIEAAG